MGHLQWCGGSWPPVSHGRLKLCNELKRETQFVKNALDTTAAVVDGKGTTSGHWVVQSTTVKRCMKPCNCFILVSHCVDAGKIYIWIYAVTLGLGSTSFHLWARLYCMTTLVSWAMRIMLLLTLHKISLTSFLTVTFAFFLFKPFSEPNADLSLQRAGGRWRQWRRGERAPLLLPYVFCRVQPRCSQKQGVNLLQKPELNWLSWWSSLILASLFLAL